MEVNWEDIPLDLGKRLEILLRNSCQDLDMISLVYVLKGSSLMRFRLFEHTETRESIVASFSRLLRGTKSFSHFAACVLTFGENEMKWQDLPAETQHTIFEKLEEPISSLCLISSLLLG
jgi:hypothetical protein